jgi:hypothetical protein
MARLVLPVGLHTHDELWVCGYVGMWVLACGVGDVATRARQSITQDFRQDFRQESQEYSRNLVFARHICKCLYTYASAIKRCDDKRRHTPWQN